MLRVWTQKHRLDLACGGRGVDKTESKREVPTKAWSVATMAAARPVLQVEPSLSWCCKKARSSFCWLDELQGVQVMNHASVGNNTPKLQPHSSSGKAISMDDGRISALHVKDVVLVRWNGAWRLSAQWGGEKKGL